MTSLTETAAMIRRREVSSVELVRELLDRADAMPELGAYITRFDELALDAARRADDELRTGDDRGPLHGIPLGLKDNIFCAGGPTTAHSLVDEPAFRRDVDSTVARRLKSAGAVILGKLTLSEFALGTPDLSSPYPRPRNPWHLGCWPGGSSAGTGVAVSAGLVMGGLGSDTAGSIRIPAALCGTTGLKPTFGRVSVAGTIPLAPSLDHVGPMARSAADCAAILAAIAGLDPADPTTVAEPVPDYLRQLTRSLDGIRLGVFVTDDLRLPAGADAAAVLAGVVHLLADAGVELEDVVLPDYAATTAATRVILAAEAFDFHHEVMQRRWAEYSRSTRTRIGAGALCTGADLVLAEDQRRHSRRTLAQLFQTVDVVVMPTVSTGAPRYGPGETLDSAAMAATAHTRYANSVGYPVLALPCGFTADGLPLSVQLMGRPFEESLLLAIGASYQQRTDWHLRDPAMTPATNPRVSAVPAAHGELPDGSRGEHVQSVFAAAGILCEEDLPALTDAYSAHRADIEVLREARARRR